MRKQTLRRMICDLCILRSNIIREGAMQLMRTKLKILYSALLTRNALSLFKIINSLKTLHIP